MMLAVPVLLLALTRSEIIERFTMPEMTKASGLVEVVADCSPAMRREYQGPVADFVAGTCRQLYFSENIREMKFAKPGILVFIGDGKTNDTTVVSSPKTRDDGTKYMRIYLPSPAYSDVWKFRLETIKGFYLAVKGETLNDEGAIEKFRNSFPELRAADEYAKLDAWRNGDMGGHDDEYFLKLDRTVLIPGEARESDVLSFASKLYLYPANFSFPFCGKHRALSFRGAIGLAKESLSIRLAAATRFSGIVVHGGGRGENLAKAADAYSLFLRELAAGKKTEDELGELLDKADHLLSIALDEAREKDRERQQ
ncbi:MAG: hypothetical protein J6W80_04615 [Kiritimatiellae bacterium]|nr:hypothetical protein [Kiritimatiellia bacterium]